MIRFGLYDAYDKWEILCRYWANPGAVTDPIIDKWNRPALPEWQDLALAGGRGACVAYIEAKLLSLRPRGPADSNGAAVEAPLNREIARLAERLGHGGLKDLARELGTTIAGPGFLAPSDDGLSPQLVERLRQVFKDGAIHLLRWTDMPGEVPSIEIMRTRYNRFPVQAIKHKKKVLSLFGALNYGRSDVIHIHDIFPEHVTLVDINAECLNDMRLIYPSEWTYVCSDFREFLNQAVADRQTYDLIVADTYFMLATEVAWDLLPMIMGMCSDTFITDYFIEMFDQLGVAPDNLDGLSRAVKERTGVDVAFTEMMPRNDTVFWAVMRKRQAKEGRR